MTVFDRLHFLHVEDKGVLKYSFLEPRFNIFFSPHGREIYFKSAQCRERFSEEIIGGSKICAPPTHGQMV